MIAQKAELVVDWLDHIFYSISLNHSYRHILSIDDQMYNSKEFPFIPTDEL